MWCAYLVGCIESFSIVYTSLLLSDAESEALVQDALNRLMTGRTVFTIAHRISTIRSADLVACLDGGRIAELGTYKDLLSRENGVFNRLMEHQTKDRPAIKRSSAWDDDSKTTAWTKEQQEGVY